MKKLIQNGFGIAGVFAAIAVVVIGGVLVWVYISKSAPLATSNAPIKSASQAISSTNQVKADVDKINIDSELDTSDIDAVLQ